MIQIGYGVTKNGKAVGIWPTSLDHAQECAHRYKKLHSGADIKLVPVFTGESVALVRPVPKVVA